MLKKIGYSVGRWGIFYFIRYFYKHYVEKHIRLNSLCLKMAIKTLGWAQKIRVGRETGNTLIFLGLTWRTY